VRHFAAKIDARRAELELVDLDDDGGDVLVVASGVSARAGREAVAMHRQAGRRAALLVVYSVWPVPEDALRRAARGRRRVVVPELNLGLYRREVERVLQGVDVVGVNRVDGELLVPEQVLEAL
jgi:2-oxoglutarate ferredoxin oxidoreductase subunit alpha